MAKKITPKKYAVDMLDQYGKAEAVRQVNECIWQLASFTDKGKVITTSYGNANQIKFWANVLIHMRKLIED